MLIFFFSYNLVSFMESKARRIAIIASDIQESKRLPQGDSKRILMRILALAILLIGAFSVAAYAQTYDPHFAICLHSYSLGGGRIDCSYTSLAQCYASASGRAAQCSTNPFFAYQEPPPSRGYRRPYR